MAFSASLPKLTLSRPAHTFTNQLLEKNLDPQPVVPTMLESKNFLHHVALWIQIKEFLKTWKHRRRNGAMGRRLRRQMRGFHGLWWGMGRVENGMQE